MPGGSPNDFSSSESSDQFSNGEGSGVTVMAPLYSRCFWSRYRKIHQACRIPNGPFVLTLRSTGRHVGFLHRGMELPCPVSWRLIVVLSSRFAGALNYLVVLSKIHLRVRYIVKVGHVY